MTGQTYIVVPDFGGLRYIRNNLYNLIIYNYNGNILHIHMYKFCVY